MKVFKVSVHIIEPGFFKTDLTNPDTIADTYRSLYNRCPEDVKQEYGEMYVDESKSTYNLSLTINIL